MFSGLMTNNQPYGFRVGATKRLIAILLTAGVNANAAVAIVKGNPVLSNACSGSTTCTEGYGSAVTVGNALIATVGGDPGDTISSVADNVNSGNWTLAVTHAAAGQHVSIYYKLGTAAGTPTVTLTTSANMLGQQLTIFEISGTSLELNVTNNNEGTTGVSNAGNLNTTDANAFLITATENTNGESSLGSTFTAWLNSLNGADFASCQYRTVSATSNYATAFATDTGGNWAAVAAAFGEASAASPCQSITLLGVGCGK